jgi:Icc-related predicted phosphoesterase
MKVLVLGNLDEEFDEFARVPKAVEETGADAVAFTGNVLVGEEREREWNAAREEVRHPDFEKEKVKREHSRDVAVLERFMGDIGDIQVPSYVIPGRKDAPERMFMQSALNEEVVSARVHMVHRSFAPTPSNYVISGFGGEITSGVRENRFLLKYPQWEAEFSLDFLRHQDADTILLFNTPAGRKFAREEEGPGKAAVSSIIKTYRPRFALCSHPAGEKGQVTIGRTIVAWPGNVCEGNYALLDTVAKEVTFGKLP